MTSGDSPIALPTGADSPKSVIRLWILGLALLLVYLANGRPIGTFDTMPSVFLPIGIIRGDGPYLDRFRAVLETPDGSLPLYATESRGHIVSRYPIAPAILAIPFELPQVLMLDWLCPGWETDTPYRCLGIAKNTAAAIAAIFGVALFKLLESLGVRRFGLWATLAAALGSNVWTVASQSLWQHGPAALALTLSMLLLMDPNRTRVRGILAGLTTVSLVCFRMIDILFAVAIVIWVLRNRRDTLAWFLPMPVLCLGLLTAYNYYHFGSVLGGQAQLEALHPEIHGVSSAWSGNPIEGGAGTLISPSRGLFIFTPWTGLALGVIPAVYSRLKESPLVCYLLWAILPQFLILSCYAVWWGGHSFGPRYWTDVIPLFAVLLAFGLEWSRARWHPLFLGFVSAIVFSCAVQAIGAFCYPSSWETDPADIDRNHARLWDWRDNELFRCMTEGIK